MKLTDNQVDQLIETLPAFVKVLDEMVKIAGCEKDVERFVLNAVELRFSAVRLRRLKATLPELKDFMQNLKPL